MTPGGGGSLRPALAACVALAVASLLLPSEPTYDPWAWIIWGREVLSLDLTTTGGPSWKPLPMLFTIPFAALGDGVAPDLWLVVARAGGFLAIVMAFRLGSRIAGPWAGAVAALGLVASESFVRHFWRGFSEGLLVGLILWAVERHLEGRRAQAFVLGVAAGLLRPEVWPFLAVYAAYLLWREPGRRGLIAGSAVLTLVAWFVPEYLGSGDFFRAASRALDANLDSAAHADQPWLEVLRRSSRLLAVPVLALAVAGAAVRRRDGLVLVLMSAVVALMVTVAGMTQAGFAGNLRYVALPAAMVCILAGVGAVELVRRGGAWAVVLAIAATVPFAPAVVRDLEEDVQAVRAEAHLNRTVPVAIAKAGGVERVNACGGVWTGRFQVPVFAWALRRHIGEIRIFPFPPGYVFGLRFTALAADPRFEPITQTRKWVVRTTCRSP